MDMRKFQTIALAATLGLSLTVAPAAHAKAKPKAFNGKTCTIVGTSKSEKLNGTSKADVICGLGGNDTINGLGGNDTLDGGTGNDILSGGENNDAIDGGTGNDTINGGNGNDSLTGDSGNDSLNGGAGNDSLQGETGADVFIGGAGTDTAKYSEKTSSLNIDIDSQADDGVAGEKDNIKTDVENITGGSGNDIITGSSAANTITGGSGNDTINGGDGNDIINGSTGKDNLLGGNGDDYIDAGQDADRVTGGDGNDGLIGGAGRDVLNGDGGTPDDVERNFCDPASDGDVVSYCGFDESAPDFSNISVNVESVDTSQTDQKITISAQVTDELMGVNYLWCNLYKNSVSGSQTYRVTRVSGTIRDGFWECEVTLSKWSAKGNWYLWLGATDYTNKQTEVRAQSDGTYLYWKQDGSDSTYVTGLGDTHIEQTGMGDESSPDIDQISVNKSSVNTSSSSQVVTISAHVTDDLSGVSGSFCGLAHNGINGGLPNARKVSGTIRDGIWECQVTLPKWSTKGNWYLWFGARDGTNKQTEVRAQSDGTYLYWKQDGSETTHLTGLGDTHIEQTGMGDESSPDIDQISVNKSSVNTSSSSQVVTISAHVTDDLSGVDNFYCTLWQSGGSTSPSGKLISGTLLDGIWSCDYVLPRGSAKGKWYVWVGAVDNSVKQTEVRAQSDGTFMYWKQDGYGSETPYLNGLGDGYVTNG
jgi:Ca2+-binding RTX toxin-like protein